MRRLRLSLNYIFALCIAFMMASCHHYKTVELPNFQSAMAIAASTETPPVFARDALPPEVPSYVPYAYVHGDFADGSSTMRAGRLELHVMKRKLEPDFIIYEDGGSAYAGQVSQYVGFGVAVSQPTYRPQGYAWCCRLTPGMLGIAWNDLGMITKIRQEQRTSGALEGDTLVSVDEHTILSDNGAMSEFTKSFLNMQPGKPVKLVWIRPGTGRMEGQATILTNPPMPSGLRSFTAPSERP